MRSIYRWKKVIRRVDGTLLSVLAPLPNNLHECERKRGESLREEIKARLRGWLLGGHILIDIFDDGHAEPVPFLWDIWSDPDHPLAGGVWDDPINALVREVFLELNGAEFRSVQDPAQTSPAEDIEEWIAWALKRNGFEVKQRDQ